MGGLAADITVGAEKIDAYLGWPEDNKKLGEYLWMNSVFLVLGELEGKRIC